MDRPAGVDHILGMSETTGLPARIIADAPARVDETARPVRRGFWSKVRANLGRVPFANDAVASWFAATDPATPKRAKAILLGALAYFVMPIDALPDVVALLGFTDDAAVIALAIRTVRVHLRPEHYDRARAILADPDRLPQDDRA
jgi:uncharacterized membrane protein YkvA (DUF1232 family)